MNQSERLLSHIERNARGFIDAYQRRRQPAAITQGYCNWRTAWLIECMSHLPQWNKPSTSINTILALSAAEREIKSHVQANNPVLRFRDIL